MSFRAGDLEFRYSAPTATVGNSMPGSAGTSLGGYFSQTPILNGDVNNVFPAQSGPEQLALNVDYQCIFLYNRHPNVTLSGGKLWFTTQTPGISDLAVALDALPPSTSAATLQQATRISDKDEAPVAGSVGAFSAPTTKAAGIDIPDIPAGCVQAFWLRRTALGTNAFVTDGATIRVEGDPLL